MAKAEDYWTPEQEDYLEQKWGAASIPSLMKKLQKSKNAIMLKRARMKLPAYLESGDYITFNLLLSVIGYGSMGYKNKSWIKNRKFPVRDKRVDQATFKIVYLEEFWKWAENNKSFIDFSKFEENALGREPDWVKTQRKIDAEERRMHKLTPWKAEEDAILKSMVEQYRYTCGEIAAKLKRSEGAVQRRLIALGIKSRPLRLPPHSPWQAWQFEKLRELITSGAGYGVMAKALNKSEKAIRGKVYTLYGSESLDKARRKLKEG